MQNKHQKHHNMKRLQGHTISVHETGHYAIVDAGDVHGTPPEENLSTCRVSEADLEGIMIRIAPLSQEDLGALQGGSKKLYVRLKLQGRSISEFGQVEWQKVIMDTEAFVKLKFENPSPNTVEALKACIEDGFDFEYEDQLVHERHVKEARGVMRYVMAVTLAVGLAGGLWAVFHYGQEGIKSAMEEGKLSMEQRLHDMTPEERAKMKEKYKDSLSQDQKDKIKKAMENR